MFFSREITKKESNDNKVNYHINVNAGMILSVIVLVVVFVSMQFASKNVYKANTVAVVNIGGKILTDYTTASLLTLQSVVYGTKVKQSLETLAKNKDVKAILVKFSTLGGTVTGSEMILESILKADKKKPVYAFVQDLSASGGVMSMIGARKIFALPSAIIGSVGVVGGIKQYYHNPKELSNGFIGQGVSAESIKTTVFRAGRGKYSGYPFIESDSKNDLIWQESIDRTYGRFLSAIEVHRGVKPAVMEEIVGASIYDSVKALELGMIDVIANWDKTQRTIAKEIKIPYEELDFVLVKQDKRRSISKLFSMVVQRYIAGNSVTVEEQLRQEAQLVLFERNQNF